jgi:hypothetical protein
MREHIKVFDNPPQYGRGIPSLYNIQIYDIPNAKLKSIESLLELLGFAEIKEVKIIEKYRSKDNDMVGGGNQCMAAEFYVGGSVEESQHVSRK